MSIIIEFSASGSGRHFMREGWSASEQHFTWTNGRRAMLSLPLAGSNMGYRCRICAHAFVLAPTPSRQEVIVSTADTELGRFELSTSGGQNLDFDIPQSVVDGQREIELLLTLPNAVAPITIGLNEDVRVLSIAVSRLELVECEIDAEHDVCGIYAAADAVAPGPRPRVAVVCAAYNERDLLPLWLAHYARQVGIANCFVIDDGSDDDSTRNIGAANVIRLPRRPFDVVVRSAFESEFCSSLLKYYDRVLCTDADEFVVADPNLADDLVEYCRRRLPPVVTLIGLNIVHLVQEEPPLDYVRPILAQRRFVQFSSEMCKATLIARPVTWSPGQHCADARTVFDRLYLFHAKPCDLPTGLRRLAQTRAMAWAGKHLGRHMRMDDAALAQQFEATARLPRACGVEFDPRLDPLNAALQRVMDSRRKRERSAYKIDLGIMGNELWEVPARFRACL